VPADGWDRATAILLVALTAIALLTFRDYGATYDEDLQRHVGQAVLRWFASGFEDRTALGPGETGNLFLYGGLFDALAEIAVAFSPSNPFEARHLVNVVFSLAAIAGAGLLGRRLGGTRAGFLAALLLATAPAWWGHGFANSKDVPFGAPYPWILLAMLRAADALPRPGVGRVVAAGVALGAALGIRPGGLTALVPVVAGTWAVRALAAWRAAPPGHRLPFAVRAMGSFAAMVSVAWAVMLAAWPWGQVNPLSGPLAAALEAAKFSGGLFLRFAGEWHDSLHLPRSYAPTHLVLTAPESWLVAAVAGITSLATWRGARRGRAAIVDHALVAAAGFLPIAAAVVLRPTLYDGMRHLLFVLPALAALLASGLSSALARLPRCPARAVLGAFVAATALVVHDMRALHPYQYVYFNRLVAGGVAKAGVDYETDYWGASYREGAEWLARNYHAVAGRRVRVGMDAPAYLASHWIERDPQARGRFAFGDPSGDDIFLATTRWFGHRTPGEILHVVERMGAPLLYVIDVRDAPGRPLRLEAGDGAVEMDAMSGWRVRPEVGLGDRHARYVMTGPEERPVVNLVIAIEPEGRAFSPDALRSAVLHEAAGAWGMDPSGLTVMPFSGPSSSGWVVSIVLRLPGMQQELTIGAARVGRAVMHFDAEGDGGGIAVLLATLATARPREADGRRRP
jgi:hypothetical protein